MRERNPSLAPHLIRRGLPTETHRKALQAFAGASGDHRPIIFKVCPRQPTGRPQILAPVEHSTEVSQHMHNLRQPRQHRRIRHIDSSLTSSVKLPVSNAIEITIASRIAFAASIGGKRKAYSTVLETCRGGACHRWSDGWRPARHRRRCSRDMQDPATATLGGGDRAAAWPELCSIRSFSCA